MPAEIALVWEGDVRLGRQLENAAKGTKDAARRGMKEAVLLVAGTAKRNYLSGPRPAKLGVLTGHLRRSIATEVRDSGGNVVGVVGSNLKYARIHEQGGTIVPKKAKYLKFLHKAAGHWVSLKRVEIPARPYLSTALADEASEVLKILGLKVFALFQKGR